MNSNLRIIEDQFAEEKTYFWQTILGVFLFFYC